MELNFFIFFSIFMFVKGLNSKNMGLLGKIDDFRRFSINCIDHRTKKLYWRLNKKLTKETINKINMMNLSKILGY